MSLDEVERYATELAGDDPECPGSRDFVKKFFGKDNTTKNFHKMVRYIIRKEMERFQRNLLEALTPQRSEEVKQALTSQASPSQKQ